MDEPDWAAWRMEAVACLATDPRQLPLDPSRRPAPTIAPLLRALREADVRWVLNGSAVLVAAGADIVPGDLDVVPDLEPSNLKRLADVITRLDGFPESVPEWEYGLSVEEVRRWRPHPAIEANLNHNFVTRHGMLDVVPRLTGTYEELIDTARPALLEGEEVMAAAIAPILDRLRLSRRRRDRERWELVARLQEGRGSG